MNDFAQNVDGLIWENFARRIGKIDGALDAIAEAEFLRQPGFQATGLQDAAARPQLLDDLTAVMPLDLLAHGLHDVGSTQVHTLGFGHRRCLCAHKLLVFLL